MSRNEMAGSSWTEDIESVASSPYGLLLASEERRNIIRCISSHEKACTFDAIRNGVSNISYGSLRRHIRILRLSGVICAIYDPKDSNFSARRKKYYYISPSDDVYKVLEQAIPAINNPPTQA